MFVEFDDVVSVVELAANWLLPGSDVRPVLGSPTRLVLSLLVDGALDLPATRPEFVTTPVIVKLNGFSSGSFVLNVMKPVFVTAEFVSSCTVNVSDAPTARLPTSPFVIV